MEIITVQLPNTKLSDFCEFKYAKNPAFFEFKNRMLRVCVQDYACVFIDEQTMNIS